VGRFDDALAQARSLRETEHRPHPLPERRWTMGQTWCDLLFAHWRVPHEVLRPHVPERLELEEHDGSAWIGLTPFRIAGLRVRGAPPLPFLSSFHELNCRTYVRVGDRPGIWFFSLDASSRAAVETARRTYRLPYRHARIDAGEGRFLADAGGGRTFRASYRGVGAPAPADPGTLEHFLVERYCLYADEGKLRAEIHHGPWPLQPAEAQVEQRGIAPVELEGEPICHYVRRLDVVIWSPDRLS
jgi:uncharacterized protein YqjF (DUF2071 family)